MGTRHSRLPKILGWTGGLAAVAVISAGLMFAQAQNGGPGGRMRRPPMGGRMMGPGGGPLAGLAMGLRNLGVTDEQRTQIRGILEQHKSEFLALADRRVAARRALEDAVSGTGDEATVRQRSTELAAVEADAAVLRARVHNEVFQVLTPEQQQKAQQLRDQMRQQMDGRLKVFKDRANPL